MEHPKSPQTLFRAFSLTRSSLFSGTGCFIREWQGGGGKLRGGIKTNSPTSFCGVRRDKKSRNLCGDLETHQIVRNQWRGKSCKVSKQGSTPTPWSRVCETKSNNGRPKPRKPFISRVFCAQIGIETMVSDHGLGRGQTMG